MNLTTEQVNRIKVYCNHASKYYDVEEEIQDHLISWVENEIEKNVIDFEHAYKKMKQVFPKEEFSMIIKSKKISLEKKYTKLIENEFLTFFNPPKIFLTIGLVLIAYFSPLIKTIIHKDFQVIILIAFLITLYVIIYPKLKRLQSFDDSKKTPLLAVKVKSRYEIFVRIMLILLYLSNTIRFFISDFSAIYLFKSFDPENKLTYFNLLLILVVLTFMFGWASVVVRDKMYEKIRNDYPSAFA